MQTCPNCNRKVTTQKNKRKKHEPNWNCYRCQHQFPQPQETTDRPPHGKWKKQPIPQPNPEYYEEKILTIQDPKAQTLCATLYLTGARIQEVIDAYKPEYKNKKLTWKKTGEGLKKNQVKFLPDNTITFLNLRVQKRRKGKEILRTVPTSTKDIALINVIKAYCADLKNDDLLFPFNNIPPYNEAWKLVKTHTGWHPHLFRHYCISIRFVRDNFKELHLKQFIGWSSTSPAQVYTHLNVKELKKLLEKNDEATI